jgi:hypothetical protein
MGFAPWIRLQSRANRGITEHQAETGQAQHQHQNVQHHSFSWVPPAVEGRRKSQILCPGGKSCARAGGPGLGHRKDPELI